MTSYLLLRSNKESGPHSLEQLLGLGLKPYDLIWVSGKSAAWRYPSEIEELKTYVPGEVEQPYDRFFKKPAETNLPLFPETKTIQQPSVKMETPSPVSAIPVVQQIAAEAPKQEIPVSAPKPEEETKYATPQFSTYEQQYIPKKSVYVTMPGQRPETKHPVEYKSEERVPTTINESLYIPRQPDDTPKPTVSITENPATAQIKYSQPLDDIKEMYVKTLQQRKDKIARQAFFKVNLKRVAVIAGLIGIGGLAGYIIKSGSSKKQGNIIAAQQIPATVTPAVNSAIPENPDPVESNPAANNPKEEVIDRSFKKFDQVVIIPSQQESRPREKTTGKEIIERAATKETDKVGYSPVETNSQTGERSRTVRTVESLPQEKAATNTEEIRPVKKTTKSILGSQVFVTTNDYKRVAFGGIRNLELTVTNNSKYELDNVLVELEYLKPSEETFRTETYRFNGIAPSEAATIRVPDTNRGIKVKYRIVTIGSRQLNADMANN